MIVFFIGDVFGKPGRRAVADSLETIRRRRNVEWVVANGENLAGGSGITERVARHLFECGVDALTTGNHLYDREGQEGYLAVERRIVKPANEDPARPGYTYYLANGPAGVPLAIISLLGRVFMKEVRSPFEAGLEIIEKVRQQTPLILVDFHAEATSEKRAFAHYVDGKVSAVIGTHTHVQTADEEILPQGTAYITDAGMTGPHDSVIGLRKEAIIHRFLTGEKVPFQVASGGIKLQGLLIDLDPKTGQAKSIERLNVRIEERE